MNSEQEKSLRNLLNEENLKLIASKLSKKDIVSILQRELDLTIPDWDSMSIQELTSFALGKFEEKFMLYNELRGKK